LTDVVTARHTAGRFTSRLNRGQQQSNQHAYDGDHHQKFNERKASSLSKNH
jgi:hypothetical protein